MRIIIPTIKAILWIKDDYIRHLRDHHIEKAQQMIVITYYFLINYLTHLDVLNGHASALILLYLSALFGVADHFFLLEMVPRAPTCLPHWSLLSLLFWLFLIFLILEYSRTVS